MTEPAPSYQWRFNGVNLPGATNPTLVLSNVQTNQAGRYSVLASNFVGGAASVEALLTVQQALNFSLGTAAFTNGAFRLLVSGLASQIVVLEAAGNLAIPTIWVPIGTNTGGAGAIEFIDVNATNYPRRFYRAVQGQ